MAVADVVTLGECLVALVAADGAPLADVAAFHPHVAGAEANTAVGIARLGHSAAYIGKVGDDGFGLAALRRLRGEGVDTSRLVTEEGARTGILVRERRPLGASEVIYHRRGSAGSRLSAADVDAAADLFRGAAWLHVTGITPALSESCGDAVDRALALAEQHDLRVSFDVNFRRKLWSEEEAVPVLRALAGRCHVLLAGEEEARLLVDGAETADPEAVARAVLDLGVREAVVLKLGARGAFEVRRDGPLSEHPGVAVGHVVDAVGAGDAFAAGYLVARLEGLEGADVLALANVCGAAALGVEGDMPGLPTRAEADRLLRSAALDTRR